MNSPAERAFMLRDAIAPQHERVWVGASRRYRSSARTGMGWCFDTLPLFSTNGYGLVLRYATALQHERVWVGASIRYRSSARNGCGLVLPDAIAPRHERPSTRSS